MNPSFADKPGSACEGHCPHGDDDGTKTIYTVQMHEGDGGDRVVVALAKDGCAGTTDSSIRSVRFRGGEGCAEVTNVPLIPDTGALNKLRLTGLEMRASQDVLAFKSVLLFFTDPNTGSLYVSDTLGVSFMVTDGGSFLAKVNSPVNLIKEHQPMKRQVVGPIFVGEIEYTAK